MNLFYSSARTLVILSVLLTGFATTRSADASTQFVGPRNTIARTASTSQPAPRSIENMQASRDDAARCLVVRIKHFGHPAKGVDRLERVEVPCGTMRLSVR
jgi:hypothetical protein